MRNRVVLFTLLFSSLNFSYSCTTVFLNNNTKAKVVARSMDLFMPDMAKILIYPRGMTRNGEAGKESLTWKSKYGSVVVTELNTDVASDGINEQGLAVHLLYLTGSTYEKRNKDLPVISNVMWAQYLLDNYKTVDEVVKAKI